MNRFFMQIAKGIFIILSLFSLVFCDLFKRRRAKPPIENTINTEETKPVYSERPFLPEPESANGQEDHSVPSPETSPDSSGNVVGIMAGEITVQCECRDNLYIGKIDRPHIVEGTGPDHSSAVENARKACRKLTGLRFYSFKYCREE